MLKDSIFRLFLELVAFTIGAAVAVAIGYAVLVFLVLWLLNLLTGLVQ